jgi:ComF family protein
MFAALRNMAARAVALLPLAETRCAMCGRAVPAEAGGLCPECRGAAEVCPAPEACPGCALPLAEAAQGLCAACRETPRPWTRCIACGPYDGSLRDMLLAYKFQARLDLGRALMETALAGFERGAARFPGFAACEALAPVPLHPRRLFARGFNQSLELSRLIAARHGLALLGDGLSRVRRTAPQMTLSRPERAENIRGAFAADARAVSGRRVLLVDDIMTTGATLEECARALTQAGAARVDVLILARA